MKDQIEQRIRSRPRLYEGFRHWTSDWGGKLTLVLGSVTLSYLFYLQRRWGGDQYINIVSDIVPIILYFGAFLMALRVSRHQALPDRARRAWRLIAFAHLSYTVGSVLWGYFEIVTHTKPFPSWADAAYLSYYPLMLVGLLLFASKIQTLEERAKLTLDAGIVTLGGGMLIWYFLLQPMAQAATGGPLMTILSLAYPVSDLVLLFGISAVLLRRSSVGSRQSSNFLLVGILLTFIADLVFSYQNLKGTYQSGLGSYGLYPVSCFLVIVSSHYQYKRASGAGEVAAKLAKETKSFSWLPYAGIAVGYGILLKFVYEQPNTMLSQLIVAATVLTVIVVSRQVMSMRENVKAKNSLQELQERFQGIYNASKDGIAFAHFDGTLVDVNEAFVSLSGYSREELLETRYQQLTPVEYHQVEREIRETLIKHGQSAEYEKEIIRKDSSRLSVVVTTFAVKGNDGTPIGLAGIIRNVTERKRTEQSLRESEEKYRNLFENAHDIIYTQDLEGNFTSVNKACQRITGYTEEESLGMSFAQTVASEYLEAVKEMTAWKLKDNASSAYELEIIAKDGHRTTLEVNSRPTYQDGKPVGVQGIARDITERKQMELALRTSEARYRLLFEDNPVPSFVCDRDSLSFLAVNDAALRYYGYSRDEFLTMTLKDIRPAEDLPSLLERLAQLNDDTITVAQPRRHMKRDGSIVHVEINARAIEFGGKRAELVMVNDITERKRAAEALRESEEKYRTILESIEDGYFEVDLEGTYSFLNDAFCRISERSEDELLGHSYKTFFAPDLTKTLYDAYSSVYKTGKPLRAFEYEITRKDGTKKFVEESVTLKRDAAGHPIGFIGIRRDCTERKQIGAELEKARDAALESARLKSEFLANMSHEIRTPMNGVIGMTGLLLDTKLSPEQREFAETISLSGNSLLTIINDILDFSKIEAGKLQFETLDFDLSHAVEGTVELLADRAGAKNIELASLIYSNLPTKLRGDPGRLRQVLTNLIGNALKFTETGEVIVQAEKESETEKDVMVRFTVTDTGIGINEAAQRKLFRAFIQADGSTTRKYGGTGLGLAISKQLVELMGGQIGLTSEQGKGSAFWFTARFEKQPAEVVTDKKGASSLAKLRVLIVDDNTTNRKILSHQLSSWEMIHDEAHSGTHALELLHAAATAGAAYDLAILDLMMPGMDGFELARTIKSDPSIGTVRMVLLTSFGQRGDSTRAREAGIGAYLTKPVRQSQLFDCLVSVVGQPAVISERMTGTPGSVPKLVTRHTLAERPTVSHKLILVAEDNIVNQKVAMRQLQKIGYRADAVANGREAFEALARIPYDLVLMDCQMPEMDGYEATAEIRRREGSAKHTTIIAMTAHALEGDREKCIAAGMDDYISKPVNAEELKQVLDRLLSDAGKEVSTNSATTQESPPPVDLERLYLAMGEEPEELFDILSIYLNQMTESLAKLDAAIASGNASEVDQIAHNCAGTSANCGISALAAPFYELERMGRENQLAGAAVLSAHVAGEFERVKLFLHEQLEPAAV